MDTNQMLLYGVALPALVALAVTALASALGRRDEASVLGRVGVALGVGAGYLVAHVALARPGWPPIDVTDRIPFLVGLATLLGLGEAARPAPGWARWENRLLLSALVVLAIKGPLIQETWSTPEGAARLAAIILGVAVAWTNLEGLSARLPSATALLALTAVAGGAAGVLAMSGSLVLGQLGGAVASALGGAWLASWWSRGASPGRGGVAVAVAALTALLLDGLDFASVPLESAGLLAAAPLAAWVGRIGAIRRLPGWAGGLVVAAAVLVPVGLAVSIAFARFEPSPYG